MARNSPISPAPGRLRIIAGTLGGRRIAVPPGRDVRPTPERVREALFSILGARVEGARVLEAYAGTGALGFEALSRGALHVTFIENSPGAVQVLRSNVELLGVADRTLVRPESVETALSGWSGGSGPWDLILADPPYAAGSAGGLLERVVRGRLLAPGGLLVFQRDRETAADDGPLTLTETRRYGRNRLDFYASRP